MIDEGAAVAAELAGLRAERDAARLERNAALAQLRAARGALRGLARVQTPDGGCWCRIPPFEEGHTAACQAARYAMAGEPPGVAHA